MNIVNLKSYPININDKGGEKEDTAMRYQSLIKSSISQLNKQGFVSLPNFLNPTAVDELISSILQLEKRNIGFYSNNTHNVFLEDDTNSDDTNTESSSSQQPPPSMHPRHIQLKSSKFILNANDIAPHTSELNNLFTSQSFLNFISSILQIKLYPSTDRYGKYYANIFSVGDGLNWHFDRSEYSISLILQPAKSGGSFQFVPNSLDTVQHWDIMPLAVEDVSRALVPSQSNNNNVTTEHEPKLQAGDMYIFRGQNSLHRVSEITSGTRINLILTYNTEPDVKLNRYTLRKFFGVDKEDERMKHEGYCRSSHEMIEKHNATTLLLATKSTSQSLQTIHLLQYAIQYIKEMNSNSKRNLRLIEQNDTRLRELWIGNSGIDGGFISSDYARLGAAIGNNTHLKMLFVTLNDEDVLGAANTEFFNGLKQNPSINNVTLDCNQNILVGGVGHEILKSYQEINNNLTRLSIHDAILDNGGDNVITETLRWCRNLKTINLGSNSITDEQLLPIVEAIKGGYNTSLEHLALFGNRIGNAGCHALATLLEDLHCSLQFLSLDSNRIGNEGATTIANSLSNNTKLKSLYLRSNRFDASAVGIFCTVLCNTSSVNDTYHSNHTLEGLVLSDEQQGQHADHLATLLNLNMGTNKSHVAIKKILKYHPNIEMEYLFEWDADGEQTLKALPYAIDWFERAGVAVAGDIDGEDHRVEQRQLSTIFQFAKAMPLLFLSYSKSTIFDRNLIQQLEKEIAELKLKMLI